MKIPLVIALCAGLILSGAAQSGEIKINARFSGNEHPTMIDTNGDMTFATTGAFQVHGAPGHGVTHSITEFTAFMPYDVSGCDLRAVLVLQNFVETLEDGAMIFFTATSGSTCLDLSTGELRGEASGIVTGGTGRFEGVSGSWAMDFVPFVVGGGVTAFTGTITGTIERP